MVLTAEHDAAIERARKRAEARAIEPVLVKIVGNGPDEVWLFRVESFSTPGVLHGTSVRFTAAGVHLQCDCEAGLADRVCCHAVACLDTVEQAGPAPSNAVRAIA